MVGQKEVVEPLSDRCKGLAILNLAMAGYRRLCGCSASRAPLWLPRPQPESPKLNVTTTKFELTSRHTGGRPRKGLRNVIVEYLDTHPHRTSTVIPQSIKP